MEVISLNNNHMGYQKQKNDWYYPASSPSISVNAAESLSKRLEEEIRAAKRTHLSCGEVLLPCGLLEKISSDILEIADAELCGLRGCTLYLLFEGEEDCRRLCTVKIDPRTTSTFELYLTFKQANSGWAFLPLFIKKIARGGTIVISSDYELTKKKLYRSFSEQ